MRPAIRSNFSFLLIILAVFASCQKDYNNPYTTGQIKGNRTSVYITSVEISHIPDTNSLTGSTYDDIADSNTYPDPFIKLEEYNNPDVTYMYTEPTHFDSITPVDTISYFLTSAYKFPGFGHTIKLSMEDYDSTDFSLPFVYSENIDTLLITIAKPDTNLTSPYPDKSEVFTTLKGIKVRLGLLWK